MKGRLPKKQSRGWQGRLVSLLLTGMLIVTGVDVPAVHAAEGEALDAGQVSEQQEQTEPEASFAETAETVETQEGTEPASEEVQTENAAEEEKVTTQTPAEEETEGAKAPTEESIVEDTDVVSDLATEEATEDMTEESAGLEILETKKTVVVNPLYEGIIDADEFTAQLDARQGAHVLSAKDASSFDTLEEAAAYVRGQMVVRSEEISVAVPLRIVEENDTSWENFSVNLFNAAIEHTEECTGQEGDALRWVYAGYECNASKGQNTGTYTFTLRYYTTYEQEQELTKKVSEAMDSLALPGKSDYQKVKAIHDYICNTVDYDNENLENEAYKLKFTAYAALCNGKAVCQGYAVAFYRMCKEAGLSVRLIAGTGGGVAHAWNIVKIADNTRAAGKYYNIDCTWDGQDAETIHTWFLLNEKDFKNHTRNDEYASAEFYAQYPMAETSYIDEGSLEEGLNKENPDVSFTTIEDTTVSSAADGKPRLLVFFRTTCGNSQSTIRAIAGQNFQGVDIYAADIDGKSKSEVESFKSNYGNDNITFCYGKNNNLYYYMQAAGLTDENGYSATLPVLCYIDSNNLFQHITQGMQNASQIEVNLKKYCGATQVKQYKITYMLDGGTNNNENPAVFKETSGTIVLKDPTKEGYTFAGWYLDAALTQRITKIEEGTCDNITLYAKWTVAEAADKLNIDNLDIDFTDLEDEYVSSRADGKPKLIIFFSVSCQKSQQTIQGIRNGIENVDIIAVNTNTIKASKEEVQSFKNTYGSDAIVFSYDGYGVENAGYLNDYVDAAEHNSITPPTICYIDANNKLQHITNGYRSANAIKADIQAYCSGSSSGPAPSETYHITYKLDGGTNNEKNPATYTADTETITLQNPTKEGCTFVGWYRDATFKVRVSQIVKGSSGNLTLYAKWEGGAQNPGNEPDTLGTGTSVILEYETVSYNGKEQKPNVTVQHGNKTLVLDNDYTLTYTDNLNAGTASVTVTGKNNYQGTVSKTFTILPAKLVIAAKDKTLYEGDPRPAPDAYEYQVEGLAEGESLTTPPTFTCDVPDPVKKGIYDIVPGGAKAGANYDTAITYRNGKLTVEGKSENDNDKDDSQYPSDKRTALKDVSAAIANIKPKIYDGNPYTPVVKVTVTEGNKKVTLTQGADYRVLYENNVNAGTGKVIVKGNGIYKGEITKELIINKKQIKKLTVVTGGVAANQKSALPVYVYDGARLLKEGVDYNLSSLTDIRPTSAMVTVSAAQKSNYEGSVKAKITLYNTEPSMIINPKNVTLSAETAAYTGRAVKSIEPVVKINNTLLEKNKHYKVQYKNNTNAGDAYVIVTGKGQYKGKVVKSFTITPLKTKLTIKKIPPKTYNGKLQTPALSVKDGKKTLRVNKDYSIVYSNHLHKGTASVRVIGKGNYAGSQSDDAFTINPQKISKASVKGTMEKGITLTYNKKVLGEGIDYTLERGEEKNGKVQIIIKGNGDFTGEMKKSVKTGTAPSTTSASPVVSNNKGKQNYTKWSVPATSYLTKNEGGTVTRVEYVKDKVYAETYSSDRKLLDQKKILAELPLFGGFYAGKNNYFLVFGQGNPKEDDSVEVIRVVKYDKEWNRQGAASLYGANTLTPFNAGSLRMTESGDMLYVRTCHTMYKSSDGLNHQANLTFSVRTTDMKITDQLSSIWNISGGYVSHSFNQRIITDGEDLVAADHGDAYPRSVVLVKYAGKAGKEEFTGYCDSVDVLPIQGQIGANNTGVSLGGLEASDTAYLVAGNSVAQDSAEKYNASGVRNIFVTSTRKNNFTQEGTTVHWITNYDSKNNVVVSTPQLVKVNNNKFLLMWTEGSQVKCVELNASGEPVAEIYSIKGALSDCQPIVTENGVLWYYTNNSKPVFCTAN